MPGSDQWREIRRILWARGIRQFSIFDGYIEGLGWQDLKLAKWDEQRALGGKLAD